MKKGIIDIGSNSLLLLIVEIEKDSYKILHDQCEITQLGKGANGNFSVDSMSRSKKVLNEYLNTLNNFDVPKGSRIVFATAAARNAKNAEDFFKETLFDVVIISAEGEAYYAARGVLDSLKEKDDYTLIDLGGNSTELIKASNKNEFEMHDFISLDIGSIKASDYYDQKIIKEKVAELIKQNKDFFNFKNKKIIGVGGTLTSMGAVWLGLQQFSALSIDHLTLKKENLKDFLNKFNKNIIKDQFPYLEKRAETLMGGIALAQEILSALSFEELKLTTLGARYGFIYEEKIKEKFIFRR